MPKQYLLVHGAWHASWCWQRIKAGLEAEGHRVLAPDLPGHGSCRPLPGKILFTDYLMELKQQLAAETGKFILLGHSMAGIIISELASQIPERIAGLVYLNAYIPSEGDSLFSLAEASSSRGVSPFIRIDRHRAEIRLQLSSALEALFFNACTASDRRYAAARLSPEPLDSFSHKARLSAAFASIPKLALIAKEDRAVLPVDLRRMAEVWTDQIILIPGDHSAYFSAPDRILASLKCLVDE